ncbi:5'-3' exonuclease domain of DNA polymerase I [Buchnera aphidicola (Cinara tujafilina)]|uniref:DNA polymerase I n=1 Tax=Buchnera aphidicola (Cinara tujafilina) TaxID=261317 RepID=F7WZI7_9GAMM|nr:DNA polymerase I [Buchnera aphidicola]AEH39854.1 5'-3' exonuclease domain of DNA polymerase I [Buchnera aphidicola (Cinara tujafilina)]
MNKKKIILIDGHFCMYKIYFAYPPLHNNIGETTTILYGMIKLINSIIIKFQPDNIIIIFDTHTKTFRHQLYKKYKDNRLSIPKKLLNQVNPLKKIIKFMGIPIIYINNFEADDIIGTLSNIFQKKNFHNIIYSADKDMVQLINKNIFVNPGNIKKLLKKKDIYKIYGVYPKSIADFLSLVGDPSDNIPGVIGIGKKTAAILLKNFNSINKIYNNIKKIKNLPIRGIKRKIEYLKIGKKNAFLSYNLTKIKTNIDLKCDISTLKLNKPNTNMLIKEFKYYKLTQYLNEIHNKKFPIINLYKKLKISKKRYEFMYKIIDNIKKLKNYVSFKKKIFVISLHLKNIDFNNMSICGLVFSTENNKHWYCLNTPKPAKKSSSILNIQSILHILKPILESNKYLKIGKNIKFIFHILKKYNITLRGIIFDVLILYYLFNPIYTFYIELKNLIQKYENKNEYSNLDKIIKNANLSYKIFIKSKIYFKKEKKQKILFESIDIPLISILASMENNGILIKKKILKNKKKINNTIHQLKINIYKIVGEKFNINSTNTIKNILFNKYKLPIIKKQKTEKYSTDEQVLKILSSLHPLPKILLQYRTLYKIQTTYINQLPKMINKITGRIHTTYNQDLTSTGRLSSSKPNLQNIPIRTKIGKKIRTAFITKNNWILLTADYSQIELRILAYYSQDTKLITELCQNNDLHYATASNIFKINDITKIDKKHRNIGKIVNFSIIYGISSFGLSKQLNISILKAKKYIKRYFYKYIEVKKYIDTIHKKTEKKGYIKTLFSRKIYVPNINSKNKKIKNSAKRFCLNALIQSTSADIIKKSMIDIYLKIQDKYPNDAKLIMQIHDELIFEIRKEKNKKLYLILKI